MSDTLPTIDEFLDAHQDLFFPMNFTDKGRDEAKAHLERLMAAERLDELKHTESAGYTTVNGDEMGYFTVIDRIAQLTRLAQAGGEE